MAAKKHIHKYKKFVYPSGYSIHKCVLDGCGSFIASGMLQGKPAICWRCGNEFIINFPIQAKPHCKDCFEYKGSRRRPKSILVSARPVDIDTLTKLLG